MSKSVIGKIKKNIYLSSAKFAQTVEKIKFLIHLKYIFRKQFNSQSTNHNCNRLF